MITSYFITYVTAGSSKVTNYQAEGLSQVRIAHRRSRSAGSLTGCRRQMRRQARHPQRKLMARYVTKRLGLAVITLVLLSMIIFAVAQLLPGDLGSLGARTRRPTEAVAEYNHEHGTDRSAVVQYVDWAGGVARGDLGNSLVPPEQPVWDVIGPALRNSLKLAVFAFVLVVPFGILGGVLSGLRVGKATDRGITVVGLSLAVVPEFVTGLVLILVFSIWAGWLPVTAQWEPGSGPLTR